MADPSDLTTLAAVKAWLPNMAAVDSDDALLSALITSASRFVAVYCGRSPFLETSLTDSYDGNGRTWMLLRQWPATAVSSIVLGAPDGPQTTLTAPGAKPGFILEPPLPSGGPQRLSLVGACFPRGRSTVQVSYTAGYAAAPFDVAQAVIELVGERYLARQHIGQSSKSLGGQETTAFSPAAMNTAVQAMLGPHRRLIPV